MGRQRGRKHWLPTRSQIEAACREIQAAWSEEERMQRMQRARGHRDYEAAGIDGPPIRECRVTELARDVEQTH